MSIATTLDDDDDGDGLGNALEGALETCAAKAGAVTGVLCDELADARDTDGDGLSDGWEVLGRHATWTDDNGAVYRQYIPIQAWGSNPRHKDIFIEVDFRRLNLQENQTQLTLKMQPAIARKVAATYGDAATTDFWLRAIHAVSINNPDRLPGISLHFDTGVAPVEPDDATIYGDWGGYNPVDAVPDGQGGWVPQRPEQVWRQQMSRGRWGVFHYVMGYTSGGGACGVGVACGFNMASSSNSSHEFGHTLGLNHNGPNGTHEPNCKPNYPSVMNYAYLGLEQFADGLGYPTLNNHALQETSAINPSKTAFLDVLESMFQYKVDRTNGNVDWNRDGTFAPAGTTVRAYANYQPGNSCESTREGSKYTNLQSQLSPAVVRHKNLIWTFAVGVHGEGIWSRTTTPWVCSPSIDNCPTPVFWPAVKFDFGPLDSIDAKPMLVNGVERIVVVGIRRDGSIFETTVTLDGSGLPAWTPLTQISGSSTASGELSLAVSNNELRLSMVYKAPDNTVRYRYRTPGGWSHEQQVRSGGQPIVVHPNTSPAVAYTYLPLDACAVCENLVGAFTDVNGYVQLYSAARVGQGWDRISIPHDYMYSTVGRPAMAWVPNAPNNAVEWPLLYSLPGTWNVFLRESCPHADVACR